MLGHGDARTTNLFEDTSSRKGGVGGLWIRLNQKHKPCILCENAGEEQLPDTHRFNPNHKGLTFLGFQVALLSVTTADRLVIPFRFIDAGKDSLAFLVKAFKFS